MNPVLDLRACPLCEMVIGNAKAIVIWHFSVIAISFVLFTLDNCERNFDITKISAQPDIAIAFTIAISQCGHTLRYKDVYLF